MRKRRMSTRLIALALTFLLLTPSFSVTGMDIEKVETDLGKVAATELVVED